MNWLINDYIGVTAGVGAPIHVKPASLGRWRVTVAGQTVTSEDGTRYHRSYEQALEVAASLVSTTYPL